MSRIVSLYRRYAALQGPVWRVLRLAVVIVALLSIRNSILLYVVLTVAITDAYIRRAVREERPLREIGLDPTRAIRDTAAGFAMGAALLVVGVGILALLGWYRIEHFGAVRNNVPAAFVRAIIFFALVAAVEEIVSRGMLFRFFERIAGSWVALAVSALIFGLLHVPNPNSSWRAGIALAIEAGGILAALYMATRSLWVPIGAHWSWNLFEGPVLGTNVSGSEYDVLVESTTTGPEVWTGGAFGPEGGLVMVIVGTLAGIAAVVVAVKRGHIRKRGEGATETSLPPATPPALKQGTPED